MPSRVIREGLLDSQRYWGVTIEARQLFVHLMLLADDFGLVSLAPVFIRRRAFSDAPPQSKIDKLIEELVTADLLRTYQVGGVTYGFVPRFRQILRIEKAKHPMPPDSLFSDDEHAQQKFIKNKDKFKNLHGSRQADATQTTSRRMPEVEVETNRRELELNRSAVTTTADVHDAAQQQASPPVEKDSKVNGKSIHERAEALGLQQYPGEAKGVFTLRVASEEAKRRTAA